MGVRTVQVPERFQNEPLSKLVKRQSGMKLTEHDE